MTTPYLNIDLDKIRHNAQAIVGLCAAHGIEVTGVTKGVCGHPAVARAMLEGGVGSIGDSRMINIQRLRQGGVNGELMMLRLPAPSIVDDIVAAVNVSLVSELSVLQGLARAAHARGHPHAVILMVDLGDLREGVRPDELLPLARHAARLPGIRVKGLGANLACFAGVTPSVENMGQFIELASAVEADCGVALQWLSAVNSSGLQLIAAGVMPARINHARIGEAILLGRETIHRQPWPGTCQDAFVLHAEVLECQRKPSMPSQPRGEDAFGTQQEFEDLGERVRALVNIGREDVDIGSLAPVDPQLQILGASSGYLVVDVTAAATRVSVGTELAFLPGYGALLRAMTSEYVEKRCLTAAT